MDGHVRWTMSSPGPHQKLSWLYQYSCKWPYDSCDSNECCHSEESDKVSYFDECCDPDECFTLTSVVTLKNIELKTGAPNEKIVQNHLNIALLNVF